MARRASNRRPQATLQASFADAAALGSVRTDITEAEMEENRRRAGLPDNWMDLLLRFGPGGLQGFADALNTARASNSPLVLDLTPHADEPKPLHWTKVVKAVERECVRRLLPGVSFQASALAARFIPDAKMVLGYMTVPINDILQAYTVCWLDLNVADGREPLKIDIGSRVARHFQQFKGIKRGCETYYIDRSDVPSNAFWYDDHDTSNRIEALHAGFALYQQDPESYFRNAPPHSKWIQDFRP